VRFEDGAVLRSGEGDALLDVAGLGDTDELGWQNGRAGVKGWNG